MGIAGAIQMLYEGGAFLLTKPKKVRRGGTCVLVSYIAFSWFVVVIVPVAADIICN